MTDLHTALQALNKAAYAAQRAYLDTHGSSSRGDYARILNICHATDKLVDDNAPGIKREAAG